MLNSPSDLFSRTGERGCSPPSLVLSTTCVGHNLSTDSVSIRVTRCCPWQLRPGPYAWWCMSGGKGHVTAKFPWARQDGGNIVPCMPPTPLGRVCRVLFSDPLFRLAHACRSPKSKSMSRSRSRSRSRSASKSRSRSRSRSASKSRSRSRSKSRSRSRSPARRSKSRSRSPARRGRSGSPKPGKYCADPCANDLFLLKL